MEYIGKESTPGYFKLKCKENPVMTGEASLHRFKDGRILEGFWEEHYDYEGVKYSDKGMWRIYLDKKND